jgi:hypothetical protein
VSRSDVIYDGIVFVRSPSCDQASCKTLLPIELLQSQNRNWLAKTFGELPNPSHFDPRDSARL